MRIEGNGEPLQWYWDSRRLAVKHGRRASIQRSLYCVALIGSLTGLQHPFRTRPEALAVPIWTAYQTPFVPLPSTQS